MARSVCESLSSFLAMDILEQAQEVERAGHDVIHLEIGQPDFETPACVNEAIVLAIREKRTGLYAQHGRLSAPQRHSRLLQTRIRELP